MSTLSLPRRIAYSAVVSVLVLGMVTLSLGVLERFGWIDSYNQDDSVLYLQGEYLKVDATRRRYQIMDGQGSKVVQASFPTRKKAGTIRIFITGESFVRGGHQLPKNTTPAGFGTISDWVQQLLEMRYPSVNFEVVNAGANGQNSYRIVAVVEELVHAEPDILVVAMGNNEGVGPASAYNQELNDWILYRMLKKAVRTEPSDRPATSQIPTLTASETERSFTAHLDRMIQQSAQNGLTLVLGTLPINLPNISGFLQLEERKAILAADPACARLDQLAQQRQCSAALEEISRCGNPFFGAVRTASCMEEAGDYERAKELYSMAIQIEPRSRTRPSYNALIRSRAQEHGLPLADLAAAMEARSPHGLSGRVDFIDHVHLTCMGYLPMARSIVEAIIAAKLVPGAAGEPLADPSARTLLQRYPWDRSGVPASVVPAWSRQVCSPDPDYAG